MVKLDDLKAGDVVVIDSGFSCMSPGPKIVQVSAEGPYVNCDRGRHYLVGQEDNDGYCVGVSWPDSKGQ